MQRFDPNCSSVAREVEADLEEGNMNLQDFCLIRSLHIDFKQGSECCSICQEEKVGLLCRPKAFRGIQRFKVLKFIYLVILSLLLNQTWVHSSMRSKANLLILSCGEGKYSIYYKVPSKESRTASAQKAQTP